MDMNLTAQRPSPAEREPSVANVVEAHRRAGHTFTASGIKSFLREEGSGPSVLCMHGMWGSSFLYRKVISELASRGMRGIAFDLPGFGLAERPSDYDYSWTGLGRFALAAVEALHLDRVHLVVHDIGGPVGFELAAKIRGRVDSLTIFNTMIDVTRFNPPWSMQPFRYRGLGELWLKGLNRHMFRFLMRLQGIEDRDAITNSELDAYLALMKEGDQGRSFLKVMRSTERTPEKQALYRSTVRDVPYPVQVVWAKDDPALSAASYGERARAATGLERIQLIPGKHFPQEDQPASMAEHIARIAA
jgi:pimeloyl-ACP methyl ester carboxylesterase